MARVRILGDHSAYHAGSAAVWEVLEGSLADRRHQPAQSGNYDVLLMNGEGSMHHGRPTFHKKMGQMEAAKNQGKRVYLVNTVWHDNPSDYDGLLRSLDGVIARDRLSQNEFQNRHGVEAGLAPDISYFAPLSDATDYPDFGGEPAMTDWFDPDSYRFQRPAAAHEQARYLDMSILSWPQTVAALRSASVLVAGRHHAMYAACKARTPFIPVRSNCHKMEGLAASAGVDIPLAASMAEAWDLTDWAQNNAPAYNQLFDWLDAHCLEDAIPPLGGNPRH